ncbi:response regulator transcription factor [Azospirillum sp. A39]|uniref:response regulator transcription factor n=1 Tax=Azospirillum sp. A39 TaxID=3462279 RepID=UPI004045EA9E
MARILIVEDEAALREDIALYLHAEGHDVHQAACGEDVDALVAGDGDIVVLDVNLPGENGFDIATRLRRSSSLGIIMLTARRLEDDRLTGLDAGADIYLSKPVSFRELAAHVRALARRVATAAPASEPPTVWLIDRTSWRLTAPSGAEVALSKLEMRLLLSLAESPDGQVDRNRLARTIYDGDLGHDSRALDALVRRLKAKVERTAGAVLPIQALYAAGYVFSAPLRVAAVPSPPA